MKVVVKKRGYREFTVRLVHEVDLAVVDYTKVEGVERKIRNGPFVKAWESLYVCHKENVYSDYVFKLVLKDIVDCNNKSNLEITTIGSLIEQDDDVNYIAYKTGDGDQQDIEGVRNYLSNATEAVGKYFDQLTDFFKQETKAVCMERLMMQIFASFKSEKITKTKVVQIDEEEVVVDEEEESSEEEGMNVDYDFDKEG